jgi:Protein of unknown function, DUF547
MRLPYFLLMLCVLFSTHLCAIEPEKTFDHQILDGLLKQYVVKTTDGNSTQVDYAGFLKNKKTLKLYVATTAKVTRKHFDTWEPNEQLAFLINNYNAWTILRILEAYPKIASIKDLGTLVQSPWKKSFIPLLGKTASLDDIEHTLIRGSGRYNDPRIHFAANCASIGCPALRAEAYTGKNLNAQLEDQTQQFMRDKSKNFVKDNVLNVSSIFNWYREDFEKGWKNIHTLNDFFLGYTQELNLSANDIEQLKTGKLRIVFTDYDWKLNSTQP